MAEARTLLPREERRASILRAAATAFAAGGFAATSMEDVAAEAGVTKLILYRHFDSKDALYRAVLERMSSRLREEAIRSFDRDRPGRGAVRSLLVVAREDPDGYRLLVFHAPREAAFEPQARGYFDAAIAHLDEALGDRVVDATLRLWAVRSLMLYLLHEVLGWLEVGAEEHDEAFIEAAGAGLAALVATWAPSAAAAETPAT